MFVGTCNAPKTVCMCAQLDTKAELFEVWYKHDEGYRSYRVCRSCRAYHDVFFPHHKGPKS